jgi:ssDNA-binding Zn-finger/Zn-ribbon topoisomerase 1
MSIIICRSIYKVGDKCPLCNSDKIDRGGRIIKKYSKRRPFAGCSRYPDCKFIGKFVVESEMERQKLLGSKKNKRRRNKRNR